MNFRPYVLSVFLIGSFWALHYASTPVGMSDPATPAALSPERLEQTAQVFNFHCADCHEEDGNSETPELNLVDGVWRHGAGLPEIEESIRDGVPGSKMRPMRDRYSAEQIADLARYVLWLGGEPPTAGQQPAPAAPARPLPIDDNAITYSQRGTAVLSAGDHDLLSLRVIPPDPVLRGAGAT